MSKKFMTSVSLQRGFSLLELVFALAVAALIIVTAVGRYQQSKWDQDLAVTQRGVQTLLQALNHYFYQKCNVKEYATKWYTDAEVTENVLSSLSPALRENPFGSPFKVQIEDINKDDVKDRPIYRLKLTAKYRSVSMANTLRQQLGADAGVTDTLTWSRLPSLSTADSSSAYWIQSDAFNQGATAGLRAYLLQNPDSKLFLGVCSNRGPKPK